MRIYIISHDLAHNSAGRAVLLAQLLSRRHSVEVVGACFGSDIWFPCRDVGIKFRKVDGEMFLPEFTHLMARLIDKLKGDVIIAVKPRPTSFGVALMKQALSHRRIILDIDDDELAYYENDDWRHWDRKDLLRRPNSPLYIKMLDYMTGKANAITVASRELQNRYGGHYITHVKDPAVLDPAKFDKAAERQKRHIPPEDKLIVFAGSPREHKGLETILDAMDILKRDDLKLLVAGATNSPDNDYEQALRARGGDRLYLLKQTSMKDLPGVLAMADAVALPQQNTAFACAQMPSKLFDAMSMGLPIAASAVSDIPEALKDDCGLLVPPDDAQALAEAIARILDAPELAASLGANARQRVIERYSFDAAEPVMENAINLALGRG